MTGDALLTVFAIVGGIVLFWALPLGIAGDTDEEN